MYLPDFCVGLLLFLGRKAHRSVLFLGPLPPSSFSFSTIAKNILCHSPCPPAPFALSHLPHRLLPSCSATRPPPTRIPWFSNFRVRKWSLDDSFVHPRPPCLSPRTVSSCTSSLFYHDGIASCRFFLLPRWLVLSLSLTSLGPYLSSRKTNHSMTPLAALRNQTFSTFPAKRPSPSSPTTRFHPPTFGFLATSVNGAATISHGVADGDVDLAARMVKAHVSSPLFFSVFANMFTCFACDQESTQQDREARMRAVPLRKQHETKRRQAHLSLKKALTTRRRPTSTSEQPQQFSLATGLAPWPTTHRTLPKRPPQLAHRRTFAKPG